MRTLKSCDIEFCLHLTQHIRVRNRTDATLEN
jgi:hypothetical protein